MNSQRSQEGREQIDRMHRETIAQSKYARRIGDKIELPNADAHGIETWSIVDVVRQDDHAPVLLRSADGKRMMTIPALRLERYELAMNGRAPSEQSPNVLAVADIPNEPKETIKERFSKRYAMVDYSDSVEQAASDDAEEALHREKAELKGVSGFFAKMLKHNIGYEITRQLELNRARTKIVSEKNIYANTGGTRAEHQAAIGAVLDRFIAEHDEFLHQEGNTGERRKVFGDSQAERAVKRELNALVRELATNPDMTEEEVDARRARIFKDANALAGDAKSRGLRYADNLREIAEEVRMAALHAGGLDNLDVDIDFAIGRAKLGARTEREKNLVDRTLERLERWGKDKQVVGGILAAFRNELAVAIASTVAIGNVLGRTALSSSAANVMTFGGAGAVTGLYSWWREKGRLNRERSLHERQMALGGDVNTELSQERLDGLAARRELLTKQYRDTPLWRPLRRYELKRELDESYASEKPRRDEMQKFAMARANAKDLAYGGIGFLTPENTLRPDADPAIVMKALAEMEARVRISNAEKVDLLRYSSPMEAEIERRNLDATRMALKAALRAAVPDFQETYNKILAETTTEFYGNEESGVRKTNEKFAAYAQNRARNVGIQTALIGAGIGYVAHEIWALASDNETVTGSIGRFASWLKEYVSGNTPLLPAGAPNVERIADGVFTTPHGTHLVPQADGSFAIETIADHKVIASGLFIGSDGTLNSASAETLRKLGASLVEADTFTSHSEIVTERVATWDWLHEHAPDVNQIKRDIWFGNDTPSPVFDFNEQRLDWGKVAGVNADGDFVMDMSSMTSDGSWQGLEEVDAIGEMANGNLRLVLTMNESSQNHAIEILFDEHGKAIIPADSDIARTFFAVKDGKAVFLGKYAEVAVTRGFDEKGVHHLGILATHIGKGLKEGVLTREIGECIPEHVTHITLPHSQPPTIIMPPILPLRPRTPLERLRKAGRFAGGDGIPRVPPVIPGYTYGDPRSGNEAKEIAEIFSERVSPTLRDKPDAVLDFAHEYTWYEKEKIENSAEYAADLHKILAEPEMSEPMSDECRVVPCIPVYTLGEGKIIAHALDQYRKQIDNGSVKPEEFEIILFLNHPKDKLEKLQLELAAQGKSLDGAEARVRAGSPESYDTEEVIRQYQEQYPQMKIRVMKKEFETRPLWGWIIKYAYDAACIRGAARKNPTAKDFLITTNDIDLRDMSDRYLREYIDELDANEKRAARGEEVQLDGYVGRIDHDNETYKKWPNFFLISRFNQFMDAQRRMGKRGSGSIDGPSNGVDYFSSTPGSDSSEEFWVITQGRNTALRASTYCAIGGARTERDAGADTELGDMVRNARRGRASKIAPERNPIKYLNKVWLESDPRRELGTYKKGHPLIWAWGEWDKMDVYGKTFAEQISGDHEDINIDRLQWEFYEIMHSWFGTVPEDTIVERAMAWLGFSGIETNNAGKPIDKDGNIIPPGSGDSLYQYYKDYEIGEITIPGPGPTWQPIQVRGIKILRTDHVRAKMDRWTPKRQRVNAATARRAARSVK